MVLSMVTGWDLAPSCPGNMVEILTSIPVILLFMGFWCLISVHFGIFIPSPMYLCSLLVDSENNYEDYNQQEDNY